MVIKVTCAKAHKDQLCNSDLLKEIASIEEKINRLHFDYPENSVSFVFVNGMYIHAERKLAVVCLFVSRLEQAINELSGTLSLTFTEKSAEIAKTTIGFDEPFMGELLPNQALLVQINIPVRGLHHDERIMFSDIVGRFENVKVTFVKSLHEGEENWNDR